MKRVVFHVDVNSAFVSWSAVKILSEGGNDIRLVPSVVSGDLSLSGPGLARYLLDIESSKQLLRDKMRGNNSQLL